MAAATAIKRSGILKNSDQTDLQVKSYQNQNTDQNDLQVKASSLGLLCGTNEDAEDLTGQRAPIASSR